ncbi:DUF1127 domain-containing protein [Zavarzinia aquatilis]|nr:DUF1127 domain-containing protein [Zavarzinia aquatilis]
MAYVPYEASRSHVGHRPVSTYGFIGGADMVTARIVPLVGLSVFLWEVVMVVAKVPGKLAGALKGFMARQRLRAELSVLDDRLLADIGIDRGQIDGVVAGRVRRDAKVLLQAQALKDAANENAAARTAA